MDLTVYLDDELRESRILKTRYLEFHSIVRFHQLCSDNIKDSFDRIIFVIKMK